MRFLSISLSLLGLFLFSISNLHASPQDQYLQIYLTIQEAERMEASGQMAEAKTRYQTSLDKLEKLQKQNPDWEPVIVHYRINYCKDKLTRLKDVDNGSAGQGTQNSSTPSPSTGDIGTVTPATPSPTPSAAPTPESSGNAELDNIPPLAISPSKPTEKLSDQAESTNAISMPTGDMSSDLGDDPAKLKAKIMELQSQLDDTKKQLAAALEDANQLRVHQKDLEDQLAAAKTGASDEKMNDLLEENKKLKDELAQAQDQLKQTGATDLQTTVADMKEQLKKTQDQLALATQQTESLQQANDDFKKRLEDAQAQLMTAQQAASKVEPLSNENKVLRGIIDRELKEQARRDAARRLAMEELGNLKVDSTQLKTQIDILSSPLVVLTDDELKLLKTPATGLTVDTSGNISATIDKDKEGGVVAEGDYATKPRIPADFKDVADEAIALFNQQKFDEAAAKYQTILNAHPDCLYALSNLGVVRFQQGKYPEAEKALREAVKLSPQDAFSQSVLGIVLYQQGKYDEAVQVLTRAVSLDPNDPKAHNYLGISASQKGWQEAAEQECRKAVEIDPNYGDAHFNLAVIYATEKPPALELARKHYRKALDLGVPKDEQLEKLLK